jgi:hypothetical protein
LFFAPWNWPSGIYIQPAAGFSFNSYAWYETVPEVVAHEGRELGLAFAIAAGKEWRLARRFGLSIEGKFLYGGTEDSSVARKIIAVQVVPVLWLKR